MLNKTKNDLYKTKISYRPLLMKVKSAETRQIKTSDFCNDKLILTVESSFGLSFEISEGWIVGKNQQVQKKGLWYSPGLYNGEKCIPFDSVIAKTLEYYSCVSVGEIIGKTVEVYPDSKNFLAIVGTEMTLSEAV